MGNVIHNAQIKLAALPHDDASPDRLLVSRILGGEKVLYAVLMRRYNQRLFRAIRAIVREDDEAQDVVQQAYVIAFDKLAQFHGDSSFGTWLTRIAVNEAFGRIRKTNRRRAHLELLESGGELSMGNADHNPEETQRREMAVA
ncbi:MAG: sigma factor [Myxococcota bacterium]